MELRTRSIVLSGSLAMALFMSGALSAEMLGYALENGDVNGDLERDLSDGIRILGHLFLGSAEPVPLALCVGEDPSEQVKNGDTNGDGSLDVSDAVQLFNWLFTGGPAPVSACRALLDGGGADRNLNPRIIPPGGSPLGQSYGTWSGDWWAWALSQDKDVNPLVDLTGEHCHQGQSGQVFYLAGAICIEDADTTCPTDFFVERTCTIPRGKAIFFPVANSEADNLGVDPPLSEEELREAAAGLFDVVTVMTASVDGQPVLGLDPPATSPYRVQTPETFSYSISDDNLYDLFGFDFPAQTIEGAVADGVFVMLAPLSSGEHTINFGAVFGDPPFFSFDITYHVTVE